MKLRWRCLQEGNAPDAIVPGSDQGLMRVESGIEIRLSGRYHPDDGAEQGHVRTHEAHGCDLAHVGSRDMVGKDLPQRLRDLRAPAHLAPIEADDLPVLSKGRGEHLRTALVSTLDDLVREGTNRTLLKGERVWWSQWV